MEVSGCAMGEGKEENRFAMCEGRKERKKIEAERVIWVCYV